MAQKRPWEGPWVAGNRAVARLQVVGHQLRCSCVASPRVQPGSAPPLLQKATGSRGFTTQPTVTTSSALHITWQTPIARCADTLATCATKRDANCSPRRVFGNTSRAAKAASGIAHSEAHLAQTERELTFYMVVLRCSATQRLALHGACGGGSPRLCIVFTTLNRAGCYEVTGKRTF